MCNKTIERCSNDSPRTKIGCLLLRPRNKDDGNTRDKGQVLQQDRETTERRNQLSDNYVKVIL